MRILFFLPFLLYAKTLSIDVNAPYACLINADTSKVLYQKNMEKKIYPASVTKIATALYIVEECDFDKDMQITCRSEALEVVTEKQKVESNFTLPPHLLENDGTTMYLHKGERLTMESLLYGLMLRSANDAANVLAVTFAPTVADFMFQVNAYLRRLGCKNTHFVNPHGLHHPDHYTTAYDLALILQRASTFPFLEKLMSTYEYTIDKTSYSPKREIKSWNKLINPESKYYMPSVKGGKTGYHRRAKRNIAAFGKKNGRSIIAVVNKAESSEVVLDDCRRLFNAAFEEKKEKRILFNAQESSFTHIYPFANKKLIASLKEDMILSYYPSESGDVDVKIHWKEISTPISKGDVVATLDIYDKTNSPILQANIFADHDLNYKFLHLVGLFFNNLIKLIATYPKFSLLALLICILFFRRRRITTT